MSSSSDKKVIHTLRTEVDDFGRKKYKIEQVVNSDQDDQKDKKGAYIDVGRHKGMLLAREESVNIEKYVGILDNNKKKKVTEVFYCDVCQEGFKYDIAYITHLNSPAHNRKLGMNMKVKAVSLESVSSKIKSLANKKKNKAVEQSQQNESQQSSQNPNRLKKENQRSQQQQSSDQGQQQVVKEQESVDPLVQQANEEQQAQLELMRQMGLPTAFGGSKKRKY